jgi:hypothetical protein
VSFPPSVVVIAGLGASVILAAGGCFNWDVVPLGGGDDGGADEPSSGQGGAGGDPGGALVTTGGPATSGAGASGGSPQTTATSGVTSSSSTSVTTGGGNDCGGGCAECISCAIDTVCAVEADLCGESLACLGFWNCSSGCATDGCLSQCADTYPSGVDLFEQAASCVVCSACAGECLDLADLLGCP